MELHALRAGYHGREVLHDVSVRFVPGQVLAVVGPNGCGKSTLLRAAAGLLPASGGQVLLDGEDLHTLSPRAVARKVAYLAQSRPVPALSARRLVLHGRFPYLGYPRRYRPEDYEVADRALARTGAAEWADRPLAELSGGQRQRVYLAMVLAQQTPVLLLDEPTTFLDIGHQREVMALARALAAEGRAVVMVLHDLCEALESAHRLAVMEAGCLVQAGSPEEILASGVLERVLGVPVRRTQTPDGMRYYFA